MNLLPKSHQNFSQKEYWEAFFKKRGTRAFEWYGEYLELCSYIHSKLDKSEQILMVGCGNSTLSTDMYDSGYRKITNIDISNVAIKQQEKLNAKRRPDMKYIVMDALDMRFDNETFTTAFDKGTLDALMSDDSAESSERAEKLFNEIDRVTCRTGRYICVSLLQEHILRKLISYFIDKWNVRIERCIEAEEKTRENGEVSMPVFVVTCTKSLKKTPVEVAVSGESKKCSTVEEIVSVVTTIQRSSQIVNSLNRSSISENDEVFFDLYKPGDESSPRYTIYILDKPYRTKKDGEYAAFIVPQGRETEWLFSTKDGRRKFLDYAGNTRLAIVILNRGQKFDNLDQIKDELNEHIKKFSPPDLTTRINYLSYGNDIGNREVKFEGKSDISGPFVVEDTAGENGDVFRRLVFMNNQNIIQSEAKLKSVKGRRGKKKLVVDPTHVSCLHHVYMSIGAHASSPTADDEIIVIGLGGGALCNFLRALLPEPTITAVDIDPAMVTTATDWFGLEAAPKMQIEIADGLEYLKTTKRANIKSILFDVDSKDPNVGISCPPKSFLAGPVMDDVVRLIGNGVFVLNLVLRDDGLYAGIVDGLRAKFGSVISYKLDGDLNEVFYCRREATDRKGFYAKLIGAVLRIAQLEKAGTVRRMEIDLKEAWRRMTIHK